MKTIKLTILIFFLTTLSLLSQMSSGYFVAPNDAIDASQREYLGNKIKVALSKAGIRATDGFFPMVTVVKYDEIETIEITGMRKMYKTYAEVSIMILFDETNTVLAATSTEIEGVGNTKKLSQRRAIKNIKISESELKSVLSQAETNYQASIDEYSQKKLLLAKKLKAKGELDRAVDIAGYIPMDSKHYKEAEKLINDISNENSKQRLKEKEIANKKEAEKIKIMDKQSQRDSEVKKVEIPEKERTNRTIIRARADVEKEYLKLFNSIIKS